MTTIISKRLKDKQLRWKQPYANAKMEDLMEVIQSINFENQYFRLFLAEKGYIQVNEFEKFVMDKLAPKKVEEEIIKNSEIVPEEVTI